jgi:hypothetical protein
MMPPDLSTGHCAGRAFFTDLRVAKQRKVCEKGWEKRDGPCPVLAECQEFGLNRPSEQHASSGVVFGGMSNKALEKERKRRREATA